MTGWHVLMSVLIFNEIIWIVLDLGCPEPEQ
jgi:hypothetical protein